MLINKNHIQGIFVYSPSAEYERGDFIVESGILYICTATNPTNKEEYTVIGSRPSEDRENFNIYLGDRIISPEEFFEYISNPSLHQDKYISSFSLGAILNSYMSGFNEKGFIEDLEFDPSDPTNPLDEVIFSEEINNAIYNIPRDSWFLQNLGIISTSDSLFQTSKYIIVPTTKVILRQYSYKENIDNRETTTRVQEIIDPLNGESLYRWVRLGESISSWKTSFPGTFIKKEEIEDPENPEETIEKLTKDYEIKERFDFLRNRYIKSMEQLKEEQARLVGNFSYREINLGIPRSEKVTLQTTSPTEPGYIDFGSTASKGFNNTQPKSMVLDIVIRTLIFINSQTYQKNKSLTIDLRDFDGEVPINNYFIDDQTSIIVEKNEESTQVTLTISSNTENSKFVNIYYRKEYEYGGENQKA